jgi:thioredoxin 1
MAHDRSHHARFWFRPIVRLIVLVGLFGTVACGCWNETLPAHNSQLKTTAHASALPCLLDLGADACVPCKKMMPVLDELEKEYQGKLEVQFIDVFKYPKVADECGVRTIPAQIFYDASGREVYRHEGFFAKEDIVKKWHDLGVDLAIGAVGR